MLSVNEGTQGGDAVATASDSAQNTPSAVEPSGLLSGAQLNQFREQGFIALKDMATPDEVAFMREVITRLFDVKAGHKEGAHFNFAGAEDDPNAPNFPQIIAPHNYAESLRKTEYYKRATALAQQILGPDMRFGSDHTLLKPAFNGPATPWHQDEAFRNPDYDYEEISIWMPLQPVNEVNGCMMFMPGTHRADVLPHKSPNNDTHVHGLECSGGFDPAQAVSCPLPAGGCTIHTGRTLHAAGPNVSGGPRLAYVLNFAIPPVPAAKQRTFPWLAEKDTARLQRMRHWMRRGGLFVETWRLLKRTEPRDYGKLVAKLARKAKLLGSLMRKKPRDGE